MGGRSSVKTETSIPELKESAVGQMLQGIALGAGQEAGDPAKAAEAVIKVVESAEPPLRLLLGQQAYEAATYKFNNLLASIEQWKEITINTDYKQ